METIGQSGLSMINNMKLFLVGIRYKNIIIALTCCGIAIAKVDILSYQSVAISLAVVMLLMMIANLANDILDTQTDSVNRPNRPLITNPSIINIFKMIVLICSILVIVLSFFLNWQAQCIAIGSIPLLIFYSKIFKPLPLVGNIVVAFYLALVFIFMEISITNSIELMIIPAYFAFGISIIREIIKDIQDYKGDQVTGIKTLPILIGIKGCIYCVIFLIVCFLFILGIIILNTLYFYYAMCVFFLVFMPLFYLIFFLIKNPTSKACREASALLKKTTILGLIIIYII